VHIETSRPVVFDPYVADRVTGSFILVDPVTNATVAAGMIARAIEPSHSSSVALGSELTWRLVHGTVVFGSSEEEFVAANPSDAPQKIDDPEAADLLRRLLDRLEISPRKEDSSNDGSGI
jgi:hypothetical protein